MAAGVRNMRIWIGTQTDGPIRLIDHMKSVVFSSKAKSEFRALHYGYDTG